MNPLRIRLRNLRTFVDLDLELPAGKIAILGGNGAGKSTLATAVDWALFGPDARSWAPYLTQGAEETELLLELEFEHADVDYRIRRTYSGRGSGKASLDLHFRPEPDWGWTPLTRETAKETQALIEQTLGLTRTTFRASSMLVQGDGAAFTEAQPKDRKQILAQILGLDRWDGYLAAARADLRSRQQRLEQIVGELRGSDEELEQLDRVNLSIQINTDVLADAEKLGTAADDEAKRLEAELRQLTGNDAARALAEAQVAQALQKLEPLRAAAVAGEQAADDRVEVLAELESRGTPAQVEAIGLSLRDLRARRQTAAAQNVTRAQAEADRERLEGQIRLTVSRADDQLTEGARLRDPELVGEVCQHCGQPLESPAAREHAAGQLDADAKRLLAEAFELKAVREAIEVPEPADVFGLDQEITAAELAFEIATGSALERVRLEERLAGLDRAIAAAPTDEALQQAAALHGTAVQALAALPPASDPQEADRLAEARRKAERRTEEERIRWQVATADLARSRAQLERLIALQGKVEQLQTERVGLHAEVDELELLVHAYGRDGIPAWIVSQVALPSIQAEACRIVAELGTSYQIELRTLRATGSGDLVDALDVIVVTEDGERPYETFSGGERTRINLALRIALARLLATRRRGESRLLVIDEPEFLDAAGTAALVQVIRGLTDFDRVWLISHVPELRDAPLDGTIQVVRDAAGWSTVTVA